MTHLEITREPLPARGDLAETSFAELLARARVLRVTGVLGLRGEKFVFFSNGSPVFVDSTLQDETSEVYLLKKGALKSGLLGPARDVARDHGRGVGEALLAMGVIDANTLFEHKRGLTRENLISCFEWRDGSARFEDRAPFGPEILPIKLDIVEIFGEGVELAYDRKRLDDELPVTELSRVYAVPAPPSPASSLSLGPADARVVQLAAARPSLRSLVASLRLESDDLRRRLFVLYCLGLIGFDLDPSSAEEVPAESRPLPPPPPTKPPIVAPTPTERVGTLTPTPTPMVAPPPTAPTARAGVFTPMPSASAGARTPAPIPPGLPPMAPRTRATHTPSPMRPAPEPTTGPNKSAAGYLEDAEIARSTGEVKDAITALRQAYRLEPDNAAIAADLALTLLIADERQYAREANRLARDARRENPDLPLPYVVMGILMEQIRDPRRATKMYEVALAKDPECTEAQRRLQALLPNRTGRK